MMRRYLTVFALLCLCVGRWLPAQDRELHWRSLDVQAQLDSAGTLHVTERHTMVFTGDWNGGERSFNIRLGQRLTLQRMVRVDAAGATHEMTKGTLGVVDHYDWASRGVLRWRSRAPSDPPFDHTAIAYQIDYTLSNILQPSGSAYLLDHDFAFPQRDGEIEQFTLGLSVDAHWAPQQELRASYGPTSLPPGEGFVLTVPLAFRGVGAPAGIPQGASAVARYAFGSALLLALVVLGFRFVQGEIPSGRFAPLTPVREIDEAWISTHVLSMRPEVAGAAWDDTTGSPEVAAVLARMVGEKKLASRVESKKVLIFTSNVLHLNLLVPRSTLSGYELKLVESLFMPGADATDTDAVRARYAKTGFDPSGIITPSLELLVKNLSPRGSEIRRPSRWPTTFMVIGGLALIVSSGMVSLADVVIGGVAAAMMVVVYGFAALQAVFWRLRVSQWTAHAIRFVVPMGVLTGGVLWLNYSGAFHLGTLALAGLTLLCLALCYSVLNLAKARQSPTLIALRKRLVSARTYFQEELRKAQPALHDAWFPYLMAFGLGPQMDRWFASFAGSASVNAIPVGRSSGSTSSGGGGWTGFGGGGGFSGGGSSGSWAAAVGTMAAGVSAPSKSSSGGGGGGGGSSGGGGGGGW
ncbi:MAG: DUF2207 domain-containing protein [Gemmatimonadaceae bacterium]